MAHPDEIRTIEDIQALVTSGFSDWKRYGCVNAKRLDDLILFNYTTEAQYKGEWNFFERVSRGLIINTVTGEIVARPFDKFFNWGEGGRTSTAPITSVTTKMDGSLGILYRYKGELRITEHRIATRGSFDSEQARWATAHWLEQYEAYADIPDELTLMFEIIYPANRVVVDYPNVEELILIGARNRFTGEYLKPFDLRVLASDCGFPIANMWAFSDVETLQARLNEMTNFEGFVVRFADGQFFKFKSPEYLRLHKLIFSLSFNGVLKAMQTNTLQEYIGAIPDEFLGDVKRWVEQIRTTVEAIKADVARAFVQAPQTSRKDFAQWVTTNHKSLAPYLFAMLDGKDIEQMIYDKHTFVADTV